jgi:hypothetical protein
VTFETSPHFQWELGQLNGIALGYELDNRGFNSRQGLEIFLFTTASRTALEPTQFPIQWVTGGREADHSPQSRTEVKNAWRLYLHSPNKPPWRGAQLRHRDNFTFLYLIAFFKDSVAV